MEHLILYTNYRPGHIITRIPAVATHKELQVMHDVAKEYDMRAGDGYWVKVDSKTNTVLNKYEIPVE